MRTANGSPHKLKELIFGRIVKDKKPFWGRRKLILATGKPGQANIGYAANLSSFQPDSIFSPPGVYSLSLEDMNVFHDGDVVLVNPDGSINFLWESAQLNNAFFLTSACNCECLMCPQPPQPHSPEHFAISQAVLKLVDPGYSGEVCLTGGEPTLLGDKFISFLGQCAQTLPEAYVIVLTNGKRFADFEFASQVASLGLRQLMICVSFHADVDELHDRIAGGEGSFVLTQRGLHNLAKLGQRIEIRCVVNRLNADRLAEIAWHIYRNYPFADHVTFMALEMTGYAVKNKDEVWVDPLEYRDSLEEAVRCLHRGGIYVSVYNHPLCLVTPWTRSFARQSISAWKNSYLSCCQGCSGISSCCGVFTTSGDQLSTNIKPIQK